eukprot:g38041.t1
MLKKPSPMDRPCTSIESAQVRRDGHLQTLKDALIRMGYDAQLIDRYKLPSLQKNIDHNTTQPCHGNLCKTCHVIDTDTTITRGNTTHHIQCDSANVGYLLHCRKGYPEAWYFGKTKQTLGQQMNGHCATIARQECFLPVREHFSGQDILPLIFGVWSGPYQLCGREFSVRNKNKLAGKAQQVWQHLRRGKTELTFQ